MKTSRYREVLRYRDFRLLVISFLVDQIGSWSYSIVIVVEVFERTHSTLDIAILSACRWIPGLLLSGYAGVIADRFERTRVMFISALGSALVMTGIAVTVGRHGPIWLLMALTVLTAFTGAPYRPSSGALTPAIVNEAELAAANGIYSTLESLTIVLGPAFGGLLLLGGPRWIGVAINTATFLVAAAIIRSLQITSTGSAEAGGGMLSQWMDGVRALLVARVAFVLLVFCALDSAIYGASSVIYAPLSLRLGTGVSGYSYLLAGSALGGVLAATLADKLSASTRLAPVIITSITLQAVPFALTTLTHNPEVAFVLQVVSGVGMIIVDVLAITALQRDLDHGLLSRVLGVFDAAILAAIAGASFAASALYSAHGLSFVLITIGVFFPVVALFGVPTLVSSERASAARVRELTPLVDLLADLDLFTSASRTVLEGLAADGTREIVSAGSVLIREGDEPDALYILIEGSLSISAIAGGGAPIDLPTVTAPGYVGELGLIRAVRRTATVTAQQDSTVLRIDGQRFLEAMETSSASSAFTRLTGVRWARTSPPPVIPPAT